MNAPQWQTVELTFTASHSFENPYTDLTVSATFRHDSGLEIRRPAFWDGGQTWRVRFASPLAEGAWHYTLTSAPRDPQLQATGQLRATPGNATNRFHRHGFWRIPTGGRNLIHADGTPATLVADTAWALPWRATPEQCRTFAADRQRKGFNAALLMTVQPDMKATGPRDRTQLDGFDVGFEDLPTGHINQLNPAYFQYMDQLMATLVEHEIVPVYQPVFHGYGWKGLQVAGSVIPALEYARYCRYLVARYGAAPAIWLVSGDGDGFAPGVDPAGWEIENTDAYQHPTGIHYGPNREPWAYQDRAWLDFQWCQTGHGGEHVPERVATMWEKTPAKAVANGEPTYEQIGDPNRAVGWWQGHEAWSNLCAGGTMGVVYGAGSLWQWRLSTDEEHQQWCMARNASWREALDFEGSRYVGLISRILDGLPTTGMQPDFSCTYGRRGLFVPGKLLIVYLATGGSVGLAGRSDVPRKYRVVDPRTGETVATADRGGSPHASISVDTDEPRLLIFHG